MSQTDRLTELGKAIGASGKWVPRVGQAAICYGEQRRYVGGIVWVGDEGEIACKGRQTLIDVCRRVQINGPSLADPCTLGGLLADMPAAQLFRAYGGDWTCRNPADRDSGWFWHPDRATAVSCAWLIFHGCEVPK